MPKALEFVAKRAKGRFSAKQRMATLCGFRTANFVLWSHNALLREPEERREQKEQIRIGLQPRPRPDELAFDRSSRRLGEEADKL
jgi:hypothetical protein